MLIINLNTNIQLMPKRSTDTYRVLKNTFKTKMNLLFQTVGMILKYVINITQCLL